MTHLVLFLVTFSGIGLANCATHQHGSTEDLYERAITNVWRSADNDEDGILSKEELALGFTHYDSNNDGRVSRHEYVNFVVKPNPQLQEFSHYLFNQYDVNNDHHIDHNDLNKLLHKMDHDGNGIVEKSDFYHFWHKMLHATAHLHGHGVHLHN